MKHVAKYYSYMDKVAHGVKRRLPGHTWMKMLDPKNMAGNYSNNDCYHTNNQY